MSSRNSKRRKKKTASRIKRGFGLALKIILFLGSAAIITVGVATAKDFVFKSDTFSIKTVQVFGNKNLNKERIIEQSHIKIGYNIFRLDLKEVVDNLMKEPWIATAAVKRRLPPKQTRRKKLLKIITSKKSFPKTELSCRQNGEIWGRRWPAWA